MSRLWAALVAGVAAVGAGRADEPPPAVDIPAEQLAKARLLVRQLGSPSYHDREDATTELAKLGRVARSALAEAVATSPDYEVRARAARLLPKAEAADLQIRIAAFVADTDGKLTHDLPAWDKFREHVGGDPPAGRCSPRCSRRPRTATCWRRSRRRSATAGPRSGTGGWRCSWRRTRTWSAASAGG